MKKQIVVSIDPMNLKQNVIDYAEALARIGDMELLIYSVQGMPLLSQSEGVLTSPGITFVPGVVEEVERFTTSLYETVKARYPYTRLEQGLGFQASSTIEKMEEIESEGSGNTMLVMPKTTDHGWWANMVGTAETAVATEVTCPVLFVPEGVMFNGITRIMYLADAQSLMDGKYKGYHFLRNFASTHSAQLVVGFIFDPENDDLDQEKLGKAMDNFKASLPLQFTHEYRFFRHNSSEEILQMAGITHTDIVAFPFRESSVFERFSDHEITRTLVLNSEIPLLVF